MSLSSKIFASDHWSAALELQRAGQDFVLITLTSSRGYAPQDPGAKALVTRDGLAWGTIGGGKVEAKAIEMARQLLHKNTEKSEPTLVTWNLQKDVGMTCGGELCYLFEVYRPSPWRIIVFGAGHVAQALARLLEGLNCQATFVDTRPEWLERLPKSPRISHAQVAHYEEYINNCDHSMNFVVMTQGHSSDLPVLKALYARFPKPQFVGCIGSEVKALKLKKELAEAGVHAQALENFHCPIGLKLGSNDPAEIAISVAAQLLQLRDSEVK